jgi:Dynein heavy chain, N-terminal region 2
VRDGAWTSHAHLHSQALADFLEQKRSALPRFYFIGDDDLLEILGQARNPAVIQEHLKKLFQGASSDAAPVSLAPGGISWQRRRPNYANN